MIESIQEADQQLFLWLNSFHTSWLDHIMYWITNKYTWFPVYALLAIGTVVKFGWEGVRIIVILALVIAASDQLTSGLMKPTFERLRPCHNPSLAGLVHLVKGCGGKYGFVSSHAANAFGLATALWLFFKNWSQLFAWGLVWASVVSYSRIYVGVHYPLDVLIGALVGCILAWLIYHLYQHFRPAIVRSLPEKYQ